MRASAVFAVRVGRQAEQLDAAFNAAAAGKEFQGGVGKYLTGDCTNGPPRHGQRAVQMGRSGRGKGRSGRPSGVPAFDRSGQA